MTWPELRTEALPKGGLPGAAGSSRMGRGLGWALGWALAALVLFALAAVTTGDAGFGLSGRSSGPMAGVVRLPGRVVVIGCALACVATAASRWRSAAVLGGAACVLGLLAWAVAGSGVDFLLASQAGGTMAYATPLVLGALGGLLCERSGVVNIAIEGQFLMASFAACVVASLTASLAAGVVAGIATGVAMAALLVGFSENLGVGAVVLGIVLNMLAAGLTGFWLAQFVAEDALRFNSAPVMPRGWLALAAAIAVPAVWLLVWRTKWGLRMRAVGEYPPAANAAGLSVTRVRWQAVLLGGVLAGLGGCYFTLATTGQFTRNVTAGYGFVALAALIMGRWEPVRTAVMALGFGFVMQLANQLQSMGTPISSQLLLVLPYVATIVAVAGLVGRVRAPGQ